MRLLLLYAYLYLTGNSRHLLLSDVADDLSYWCFDGDFHLTASAAVAGAAATLPGTALELTYDTNHLLQ